MTTKYLLSKFQVFNNENKLLGEFQSYNKLFIPKKYLIKNNYSEYQIEFFLDEGIAILDVISPINNNGRGYLSYSIRLNNFTILQEDMSCWKYNNSIVIYNLKRGDIIKVRVEANKNCRFDSWERASTLEINNYTEHKEIKRFKEVISFNSPYSEIQF